MMMTWTTEFTVVPKVGINVRLSDGTAPLSVVLAVIVSFCCVSAGESAFEAREISE